MKNNNPIPLPTVLRKNGYSYVQHRKGTQSFIYEQRAGQKTYAFEVFTRQILPAKEIFDKILPEREKFPKDEDFGFTAWTYRTLDKALQKFEELEKKGR